MTIWIDSNNVLHDDMDGAALSLPSWPQGMKQATQEQITAATTPAPIPLPLLAQVELDKSDVTCMRILSAGQAIPGEWQSYRVALRGIANKTDTTSTALPARPAYLAGT